MISIFHFNILTGLVYSTSLDWFFAGQLKSMNSVFISVQDCKDTHAGIFKYRCPQCEYKSNKYKQYTRHLKVHSSEKPFQCPICQHQSSTTSGLEWERGFLKIDSSRKESGFRVDFSPFEYFLTPKVRSMWDLIQQLSNGRALK